LEIRGKHPLKVIQWWAGGEVDGGRGLWKDLCMEEFFMGEENFNEDIQFQRQTCKTF